MAFRYVFLSLILSICLAGCCEPCEKPDWGTFSLTPGTLAKATFSGLSSRTYVSSQGQERTFTQYEPVQAYETGSYNCDFSGRCAVCCETYTTEYFYVQMTDPDNQNIFEFSIQKDFFNHTPKEAPDSIGEVLFLAYNTDRISGSIQNLLNTTLTETVTLDGKSFQQVRKFSVVNPPILPDPNEMTDLFFSLTEGIVGFIYADGTEWRLK